MTSYERRPGQHSTFHWFVRGYGKGSEAHRTSKACAPPCDHLQDRTLHVSLTCRHMNDSHSRCRRLFACNENVNDIAQIATDFSEGRSGRLFPPKMCMVSPNKQRTWCHNVMSTFVLPNVPGPFQDTEALAHSPVACDSSNDSFVIADRVVIWY